MIKYFIRFGKVKKRDNLIMIFINFLPKLLMQLLNTVDNVSVVFVAFKNFEEKMKDPNFEYNLKSKCTLPKSEEIDFNVQKIPF